MRTYAGHSTAKESNELYRRNIEKGQTGLSIAFDLPTQTGYDPDDELARGEVGKVGVSIAHKGDMHTLLDGIPLQEMNTSMTINATAAWLLALYMTVGEENGIDTSVLQGTTQNDIIKEFLSRGTYAFPPGPSMRLIADMIAYTVDEVPKWNPINICSYHLQEAGATPVQEIAYALSTARAVLDQVRERVTEETFPRVFGRISFFVNAGIRFIEEHGGAVKAVDYMKTQLVESHRERVARIERGEQKVVGQNVYTTAEPSPLQAGEDGGILTVDPEVERAQVEAVERWRAERDEAAVRAALAELRAAAENESLNVMPATLAAARAGATTGEWAGVLREVFGEYRAPTGVEGAAAIPDDEALHELREKVDRLSEALGRRVKILVGKPGLDGHSNGAEQIAVRARDAGMDVVYEGIRLTPSRIAATAVQEGVHVVGLSILSGSHRELIPEVLRELREAGADVPVVVGGIIPPADAERLLQAGVARVYTPKDFELTRIMGDIVDLVAEHHSAAATA